MRGRWEPSNSETRADFSFNKPIRVCWQSAAVEKTIRLSELLGSAGWFDLNCGVLRYRKEPSKL